MRYVSFLLVMLVAANLSAQPATAPATKPAGETLLKGALGFQAPEGWTLDGKSLDGKRARYSRADPSAMLDITVITQETMLNKASSPRLGQAIIANLRENAETQGIIFVDGPRIVPDDSFYLRIHYKFTKEKDNGEYDSGDQRAVYRVLGLYLVSAATTVFSGSADDAKKVFAESEKTLFSVRGGKPQTKIGPKPRPATRPTELPAAKLSLRAPAGWTAETNENSTGIVATYRDPAERFNTIIITVRPLPPEAKRDPKLREPIIEDMASNEKTEFKFDNAQPTGETETIRDTRFLRKQRIRYETPETKIQVTTRIRLAGDAIVSIAMASVEESAADIDRLADEVALSVKPTSK